MIEKLIPEIIRCGYRVATIKHGKEINLDPEKDSSRHLSAGSTATALVAGNQLIAMKPHKKAVTLTDAVHFLGDDCDLIICEGFKQYNAPKILVRSRRIDRTPDNIIGVFAEVNDEPSPSKVPQFDPDDVTGLANIIIEAVLKSDRKG